MSTTIISFDSIFKQDYAVVEEKRGNIRFFPHTDQLPILHRALDFEFTSKMPARYSRLDKRAGDFDKLVRSHMAHRFTVGVNSARSDNLILCKHHDPDLITSFSIVQQRTEHTKHGALYRFAFYSGSGSCHEIYLSGRRLAFTEHAVERFLERMPGSRGLRLNNFVNTIFDSLYIALPCGDWFAFVLEYDGSLLALPFSEVGDTFVILSALDVHNISSLREEWPVRWFSLHYHPVATYQEPQHWSPIRQMVKLVDCWERKASYTTPEVSTNRWCWYDVAHRIKDHLIHRGHGPGSQVYFVDHVYGPNVSFVKPGCNIPAWDDIAELKQKIPQGDWKQCIAQFRADKYCKPSEFGLVKTSTETNMETVDHFANCNAT